MSFYNSNLFKRIASASVLFGILLGIFYLGTNYILALISIISILMIKEYFDISFKNKKIFLLGLIFITSGIISLILCLLNNGSIKTLNLLILAFVNDTCAYIFGRIIKGPKLAPKISPGKTISGFVFGNIFGIIIGNQFLGFNLVAASILSVTGHLGDLLESYTKRVLDVKDSSGLIPGHGGILDRLDSVLTVSIVSNFLTI